jgi:uncharacterized membrane protein
MRRTLLFLLGLVLIGAVLLLGRQYFDAHPVLLALVIAGIVVLNVVIDGRSSPKKPPIS